jgi:hypothetical protein
MEFETRKKKMSLRRRKMDEPFNSPIDCSMVISSYKKHNKCTRIQSIQ